MRQHHVGARLDEEDVQRQDRAGVPWGERRGGRGGEGLGEEQAGGGLHAHDGGAEADKVHRQPGGQLADNLGARRDQVELVDRLAQFIAELADAQGPEGGEVGGDDAEEDEVESRVGGLLMVCVG